MSWTPATSIGLRAALPSRMRILSGHRESTDLFRPYREGFDLVGKDPSPGYVRLFTRRSTPLSPFLSTFAQVACRTWTCEIPFSQAEMGPFCTILVQSKSFKCNTSELPSMCCKQRTCGTPKSFTCNTYKKHRGWGVSFLPPLRSSLVTHHPARRRRPFR